MLRFRPFRNHDPAALAEIWRSQPPHPRLAQPMSPAVLDQFVLSKPYFDRRGLILAFEGAQPVGFVHVGLGPTPSGDALDPKCGVICQLMAVPRADRGVILAELLAAGEDYLRRQGAEIAVIGGADRWGPFYRGLYGGAGLCGVLRSDAERLAFFQASGYLETSETILHARGTLGFTPPMDRDQVRLRRLLDVVPLETLGYRSWWEACAGACVESLTFELQPKTRGAALGSASFWEIMPLGVTWGVRTFGLDRFHVREEAWRDGTALMFLAELLKIALSCRAVRMEATTIDRETEFAAMLAALGFEQVDRGVILSKRLV